MYKVMKTFVHRGCVNPVTSTGHTSVDIGVNANLELVDTLQRAEMRMVRWMCGVKLQDRIPSKG